MILRVAAALAICLAASAGPLHAHPLHTSVTIVHAIAGSDSVVLSVRVFEDDFTRASNVFGRSRGLAGSRARAAYVAHTLVLNSARGERIALRPCGEKRMNDMLWLCFAGQGAISGGSISNRLMFDTFRDQINVVRTLSPRRRESMLFAQGDPPRRVN